MSPVKGVKDINMNLRQFEKWLKDVEAVQVDNSTRLDASSWRQQRDRSGDAWDEYVAAVCDSFGTLEKHFGGTVWANRQDQKPLEIAPSKPPLHFMPSLNLSSQQSPITLRDFQTKELNILSVSSGVTLSNLVIYDLHHWCPVERL
jgi:hypothetical protein